jgi:ABC-type Na+ efflux pump permease subunit
MLPLLVQRELRVALLRRKAHSQWMVAAWSAGGITLFFVLVLGLSSNRSSGRTLFHWLFALAIAGIVTRGFGLTADLFSEERRNGTLGLLVLTGLRPWEIFTNKLLGATLLTAYGLLGGLPFFAIPFLAGGVPASHFLCAFAFLVNGLLFCIAVGLFASVTHREGGQAQLTAQALSAVLCAAIPFLHWLGLRPFGAAAMPFPWLALSPAYPPYLVFTGFAGGSLHLFWIGSAITLGYSLTALLLAAVLLQHTWREGPDVVLAKGWRARWRVWMRGSERWQHRLRSRLLADQPFCWLAARDRRPILAAYGILALAAAVWLAGRATVGPRWLAPANAFISSIVLHQALNLVAAYAAARRFAEERLSGGFEILLTAPLRAGELVEGQNRALLVQFRVAAGIALMFDAVLCFTGLASAGWSPLPAAVAYLVAWVLMLAFFFAQHLEITSRAMWISAWTGRPGYAAVKAGGSQWWLLFWVWLLSQQRLGTLFRGNPAELCFLGLMFAPLLLTFGRRHQLRTKLTNELRQIAAAPIPARNDKRFRSWNPDKIFPPGRWGDLVLRPAVPPGRKKTIR